MRSLLLNILSRTLFWILGGLSIYLLFRGHNAPGGGFIGGLVAAIAFILLAKAIGQAETKRWLRVDPVTFIVIGLLCMLSSGLFALFHMQPFMTGQWVTWFRLPISSIIMFDTGVYLTVLGSSLTFLFSLEDAES